VALQGACLELGFLFGQTRVRFFVPFPAEPGSYLGITNGLGDLPMVVTTKSIQQTPDGETTTSGSAILNSAGQILVQGDKDKRWTLRFQARPANITLSGL
jgi:hypothetical protein